MPHVPQQGRAAPRKSKDVTSSNQSLVPPLRKANFLQRVEVLHLIGSSSDATLSLLTVCILDAISVESARMPGLARRLLIFAAVDGLILEQRGRAATKITYKDNSVLQVPKEDYIEGIGKSFEAFGLVGE